jgi:predicted RNA binding protein YcfA (HicA-like mRNA interferase family)
MSRRLPTLRPRQVIRVLERTGFVFDRTSGAHRYFVHPARPELLVCVPVHPGDLKRPVLTPSFARRASPWTRSSICCESLRCRHDPGAPTLPDRDFEDDST